jgi:hypothetical protein
MKPEELEGRTVGDIAGSMLHGRVEEDRCRQECLRLEKFYS